MTVEPTHKDLTIQDAADLLRLSRLQLNKLIETGVLPVHRIGNHKRVPAASSRRHAHHQGHRMQGRGLEAVVQVELLGAVG